MPKITGRDASLILDVYKHRYLSVSQVETLHFPSKRTAYRRLQALTALSYLKAFTVPNIPERVYYLDKAGADVVAAELQVSLDDLQWHRYLKAPKDYYFLRHFLAINDFRIQLTLACQQTSITLLGFIPEYYGEKTIAGNVKKYIRERVCDIRNGAVSYSHTPDGVFALEKDGKAALFFLEIDRGTEIVSDPEKGFLKAITFYLNYWVDEKWKRYSQEFGGVEFKPFHTLIVTTSEARLQHMRQAVTAYDFDSPRAKRFLWGTVGLTQDTMFDPVWLSMDGTDNTRYQIG